MRVGSILFLLMIHFSSSVMADIKFSVSPGVSLIVINGIEVESSSFFHNNNTLTLPNGINQILVQYSVEIKKSGSLEVETTDPHVLVFNEKDKDISLLVPDIKRFSEFRKFNESKSWTLKDSTGRSIEYLSKPLIKEGFQINRDYERELQKLNESGDEVSIATGTSSVGFTHYLNESNKKSNLNNLPETLLQYWYLKADIETRKRFKSWVRDK